MIHKDLIRYYISSISSFVNDLKLSLPKASKYVVSFCVFVTHKQMLWQIIFVIPNTFIETEDIAWAFLGFDRRTGKEKLIPRFHNFLRKFSTLKSIYTTNCTVQTILIRLRPFYLRETQFQNNGINYLRWNKFYAVSTVKYDNIHRSTSTHFLNQFIIAYYGKGENFIFN